MKASLRPLAILLPLVAATALKGHALAKRELKVSDVLAGALLDAAAAIGLLITAIHHSSDLILLCVVGAVLPTAQVVLETWLKANWSGWTRYGLTITSIVLCGFGAGRSVHNADSVEEKESAAVAFASLLPSIPNIVDMYRNLKSKAD